MVMDSPKKKPDVSSKKVPISKKAGKIIKSVEKTGGFKFPCGHFIGASAKDLRILIHQEGPDVIIEIVKRLEEDHDKCR